MTGTGTPPGGQITPQGPAAVPQTVEALHDKVTTVLARHTERMDEIKELLDALVDRHNFVERLLRLSSSIRADSWEAWGWFGHLHEFDNLDIRGTVISPLVVPPAVGVEEEEVEKETEEGSS